LRKGYAYNNGRIGQDYVVPLVLLGLIFVGLYLVVTRGFPDEASAKTAIEANGFRDVTDISRHYWGSSWVYGCSDDDAFAFTATATNANNQKVAVTACTGYFVKGYTIRIGR
jgi:hypothetical protein